MQQSHKQLDRLNRNRRAILAAVALALPVIVLPGAEAQAVDNSSPAILQDFENTWSTISNRMADVFAAGYGGIYTPPPGRADSGNQSVGYDVYDRFDLGSPGNPTLYGTRTGLKSMINAIHTAGAASYIDLVWNQSGFSNQGNSDFEAAGGYPGFAITLQTSNPSGPGYNTKGIDDVDGDYHPGVGPGSTGDQNMRLAGLIDIDQGKNYSFIRNPVTVGDPNNIPPGMTPWNNRLANIPTASNAQFYPDKSLQPIIVYDPKSGEQNIKIYPFNEANPMAGDPVQENALGYLMRNAQWLIQDAGADGFRVDAAKNMPSWVLNYLDRAVYRSSPRTLLDGTQRDVFSFSEVFDGDQNLLQSYVRKDINHADPGTVGGNRDVLDFPLYFALSSNLSGNGNNNDWANIKNASFDLHDDGLHNGSEGVKFVSNQDNVAPYLSNVAYAYTLMLPGNAVVYYNAHEFGDANARNFPKDGRGDALGGLYGNAITTLVDLRNRYGRGNYHERWSEQHNFAYEREGSALVLLNSEPYVGGYDSRTLNTTFAPGTLLLEQTGNAHDPNADPFGDIPQVLTVNADKTVNVRFLHNVKPGHSTPDNGAFTGDGYLVYGLPTPQGSMNLTNVAQTLAGGTPTATTNGTTRLANISVIKADTFLVQLNTVKVQLLGQASLRDHDADGDNAILRVDGGIDINGNGVVDHTTPGGTNYGYEEFTTVHNPGYTSADNNGSYSQNIDTTKLSEGYHYISIIAYRHRSDGGPAVYSDWKQTIYVDRLKPQSTVLSFNADVPGTNENRQLRLQSLDQTATNMHAFLDLPAGLTDAQVVAMVGSASQPDKLDVDIWQKYMTGVSSGNHVATVVTFEIDGTTNVQRFNSTQDPFLTVSSSIGRGIGDLNFDGSINASDMNVLSAVVSSNNQQFNAAADVNGDGQIDLADTFLMGPVLSAANVDNNTWNAFNNFIHGGYVTTHTYTVNANHNVFEVTAGTTSVLAGASLTATYVRGNALSIAASGIATIRANPTANAGTSKVSSLTLAGTTDAWTSKLDLTNNDLIVQSSAGNAATDLARVVNQLKQGYNDGGWDGVNGIVSSTASAANPLAHALGVMLNDNGSGGLIYQTFDGLGVDNNSILVKYTFSGDANLDGSVGVGDLGVVATNYGATSGAIWGQGDFNYDGAVNVADLGALASYYGDSLAGGSATAAIAVPTSIVAPASITGTSSVPEPSGLTILAITAVGLLNRRRRCRNARQPIHISSSRGHAYVHA